MSFGRRYEYDDELRRKRDFEARSPEMALTNKEKKDLALWDTIRFYETLMGIKRDMEGRYFNFYPRRNSWEERAGR